jgi:BirA family biotin operon repressor/biotin-[acetyl-CoA-carboxylase] ligase
LSVIDHLNITELAQVSSTNDWLAERAAKLPDASWVRAHVQTGGRGRRGRVWVSQPGNLFASVLARPQPGEGPPQQLSFVAALALDRALLRWVVPERLSLKWPNDLLFDGVKCAGILLEAQAGGTIIGFGVNLVDHPTDVERPATSLAAAGITPPGAAELCAAVAESLATTRAQWRDYGFASIRTAWLARASDLGHRLEARLGHEMLTGRFEDLAADGALLLRLDDQTLRSVHAGEVFAAASA